jgi:hypothetical protein
LKTELKETHAKLNTDASRSVKAIELRHQSKMLLAELQKNVALEKSKKSESLTGLEKDARARQEAAYRRQANFKRRAEITEAAAM